MKQENFAHLSNQLQKMHQTARGGDMKQLRGDIDHLKNLVDYVEENETQHLQSFQKTMESAIKDLN